MHGKLVFYYGTVNSSKTMQLLSIAHNYEICHWLVLTIKPSIDNRSDFITTRAGVPPRKTDISINKDEEIISYKEKICNSDVILVDECQFLTAYQVDELRKISYLYDKDILCFGLRTDSNTHLFEASKRLFELADEIIEIKTICSVCGKHATFNKKIIGSSDKIIDVGWDNFTQVCWEHFNEY